MKSTGKQKAVAAGKFRMPSLVIDDKLYQELLEISQRRGESVSFTRREAIRAYVERQRNCAMQSIS